MASKVILVTGSSSGIGFEVVRLLAQKGYTVYLSARREEAGKEALSELNLSENLDIKFVQLDVTDSGSILSAKDVIEEAEGRLDILINNAGVSGAEYSQDPYEMSYELLDHVFKANFFGAVHTTTAFLPLLKKSSEPTITNVSSELGSNGTQCAPPERYFRSPAYAASKAALNSYTINLAHHLEKDGFKVNAVVPGSTATKMNDYRGARTVTEGAESIIRWALLEKDGPTGRLGYFEEGEYPW
ncbi:hypothetical protein BDQ17DRAFT_353465 [Cyathus striatus]|nr:hypothetical protein BDQ17DRAFT_353465 [Cyathus striatus]